MIEIPEWHDTDIEKRRKKNILFRWINKVNKYAWVKIKTNNKIPINWLSVRAKYYENSDFWKKLSNNRESAKYFKKQPLDPAEGIFFVKTDFLIKHVGNLYSDEKIERVNLKIKKDEKMSVPFWDFKYNNVGEGNHRVLAMSRLGMKSVPIRIVWDF